MKKRILILTAVIILSCIAGFHAPWNTNSPVKAVFADETKKDAKLAELLRKLEDEDAGVREKAVDSLKKYCDPIVFRFIILSQKKESWQRNSAIDKLGLFGNKSIVPYLIKLSKDHEDNYTRGAALESIVIIEGKEYSPFLIQACKDNDYKVRGHAVYCLGKIGDKKVVPHLITMLNDKNQYVRMDILRSLGRIGDKSAVPYLYKTLNNLS